MADLRNILVLTASQITTKALNKEKSKMSDLSEDRRKVGNVDLLFGICGTEEQIDAGFGKILIIAGRSIGHQGSSCYFTHCLDVGQFFMESWVGDKYNADMLESINVTKDIVHSED
jgi:hypothetical protein